MIVKNAKSLPQVYYGLHMVEGVAEYREPNKEPNRIFIGESTIKNMDATFSGKPVYVQHVEEVDLANLQAEADGYVVRSFFNKADGKHWAQFIVVSDKGHEAIRNGWKLSNAYLPKSKTIGGQWHGVDYSEEVLQGEYEHLAIVPNPRYAESVIMTPEEFKRYNSEKESEIQKLSNSKENESMLQFFKKTKVENSAEFEGTSVLLPKSKIEMTVAKVINEMDDYQLKMKEPQMANGDHHVMVGDEKMTVNELVAKHMDMKNKMGGDMADKDAVAMEDKGEGELVPNAEEEEDKKKKEAEGKKQNAADKKAKPTDHPHFDVLKNAPDKVIREEKTLELASDKLARGKSRYGSN